MPISFRTVCGRSSLGPVGELGQDGLDEVARQRHLVSVVTQRFRGGQFGIGGRPEPVRGRGTVLQRSLGDPSTPWPRGDTAEGDPRTPYESVVDV